MFLMVCPNTVPLSREVCSPGDHRHRGPRWSLSPLTQLPLGDGVWGGMSCCPAHGGSSSWGRKEDQKHSMTWTDSLVLMSLMTGKSGFNCNKVMTTNVNWPLCNFHRVKPITPFLLPKVTLETMLTFIKLGNLGLWSRVIKSKSIVRILPAMPKKKKKKK